MVVDLLVLYDNNIEKSFRNTPLSPSSPGAWPPSAEDKFLSPQIFNLVSVLVYTIMKIVRVSTPKRFAWLCIDPSAAHRDHLLPLLPFPQLSSSS